MSQGELQLTGRGSGKTAQTKAFFANLDRYPFKLAPLPHQIENLTRYRHEQWHSWRWDTGTGKTYVGLHNAALLWLENKVDLLLVIAPNHLHVVWRDEAEKHLPDLIPTELFTFHSNKSDKALLKGLESLRDHRGRQLTIITMNVEALSTKRGQSYAYTALKLAQGRAMMLIDESHKIKTPGSARTKAAIKLGELAAYRRTLTATPMDAGYEDLYSQYKFLSKDIIGLRSMTGFRAEYCIERRFEHYSTIVGYRNVDQLLARIAPYTSYALKEQVLTGLHKRMPPVRVPVEVSAEQKRIYNELREDFLTTLPDSLPDDITPEERIVVAEQAMTRLLRLQQILSGYLPLPEGDVHVFENIPRIEVLFELIESANSKVLVWSRFRPDVKRIAAEATKRGVPFVNFFGETKEAEREHVYHSFKSDKNIRLFNATGATGGAGLTLIEAPASVYYSHTWSSIEREQTEGRNHRHGQLEPVTWYDLEVPKSMDTRILNRVTKEKRELSSNMVRYLEARAWVEQDKL